MNKNPDDRDPSHINALVEQRAERARKEAAERAKQAKAKQKKR